MSLAMLPVHVVPLWRLVLLLGVMLVLGSCCMLYLCVVFGAMPDTVLQYKLRIIM